MRSARVAWQARQHKSQPLRVFRTRGPDRALHPKAKARMPLTSRTISGRRHQRAGTPVASAVQTHESASRTGGRPPIAARPGTCFGNSSRPRVAVCYFGLTRSTRYVAESHQQQLLSVLRQRLGASVRVFLHTWATPDDAQDVWGRRVAEPQNESEAALLTPHRLQRDAQQPFLDELRARWSDYEPHPPADGQRTVRMVIHTLSPHLACAAAPCVID